MLADGRSGKEYIDRVLGLRAALRERLASLAARRPVHVALTTSTGPRAAGSCSPAWVSPPRATRSITTTDEHFGLLGPLHSVGRPRRRRSA